MPSSQGIKGGTTSYQRIVNRNQPLPRTPSETSLTSASSTPSRASVQFSKIPAPRRILSKVPVRARARANSSISSSYYGSVLSRPNAVSTPISINPVRINFNVARTRSL